MFYLDGEELATVNDCPETAVRGPKGHYVAALAATHQIHCVVSEITVYQCLPLYVLI